MAATERSFSETPPAKLYLDTNFILDYLISTRPNYARVRDFLQRAAEMSLTHVHISSLSWVEFGHVVRRQDFRDKLPDEWRAQYQLDQWEDLDVRRRYLGDMCKLFEECLVAFEWTE